MTTAPLRPRRAAARAQRGITLFGLIFWAFLVGFTGYLLVRTLPTVNEYLTIRRAVERIAASQPATVAEVRQAFDRQREVEYGITAVTGKDLVVTKEGERVVVSFAYDKLVPVWGPVNLLIKYEGSSR
jgi:hypothetical protein